MKRSKGVGTHRVVLHGLRILLIIWLILGVTGCNERLQRMESNQIKLNDKIDHNSHQVLLLSRHMANSQQYLESKIEEVRRGTEIAQAEAQATRYEQERLREEVATFNKKYFAEATRIEEQNRLLQNSVSGVAGGARIINQGVKKLDAGQQALQTRMDTNHEQMRNQLHVVTENQADLQKTADAGVAAAEAVGSQVAVVKDRQDRLVRFENNAHQTLVTKVDSLAEGQQQLQRVSRRNANRLSQQLDDAENKLGKDHEELKSVLVSGQDKANNEFSSLKAGQGVLSDQMSANQELSMTISSDVNDVKVRQDQIYDLVQQGTEDVDQDQEQIQTTLNDVQATTGTLARDTEALKQGQQQAILLSRRVATLEMGLADVNRNVAALQANLTTRMSELASMMRADQQTRPDISGLMTELNSLSEALRKIQSTQDSLSARLDQVSAEAKQQSEAFMAALANTQKQNQTVEATPSPQQPEQTPAKQPTQETVDTVEVVK